MDGYKKVFKTRRIRFFILNLLRFIPDRLMLKIQYRIKMNRKLDLNKPKRFSEKIQYYKLHYRKDILHKCVDKYLVRQYIESKGLEKIIIPLYGYYKSLSELDLDTLPSEFVIKTTNGGGGLNVCVCKDKKTFELDKTKLYCKKTKSRLGGREWAYYGVDGGIIIEKLLKNDDSSDCINDYKFLCFNGIPKYVVVDVDRYTIHKRKIYDIDWNDMNVDTDCKQPDYQLQKPANFNEMLDVAKILSADFPFVRVDLYSVNGKTFFGELTFYPWSGYVKFVPDSFDFVLGDCFNTNFK